MTQPSLVLDAIVTTLQEQLGPAVDVRATDDLTEDLGDTVTFRAPAVIVSCGSLGDASSELGPLLATPAFVARCYARLPSGPQKPNDSRGDVAMNLAAVVASVVEGSIWRTEDGAPLAIKRASGVGVRNRTTRDIAQRGYAMWVVSWQQQVELTREDVNAALHAFKTLHVGIGMGTSETPDAALTLQLEGREP